MKHLFVFLSISTLLVLMVLAGRWGLAGIYANEVRFLMQEPEALVNGAGTWSRAEEAAAAMQSASTGNPDHLSLHGRLIQARLAVSGARNQRETLGAVALGLYGRSAGLRPSWPQTWAQIVETKGLLNQYDDFFDKAFRAAGELGPWEPGVVLTLAGTGLMGWNGLSDDQRSLVLATVQRGLKQQPRIILELAKNSGRLSVVCTSLADKPGVRDYCRNNL